MSFVLQTVIHTPLWVWPLLLLVVGLGVLGLRPAVVPVRRLLVWPAIGLGLAVAGVLQSPQPLAAAAGGLLAVLPGVVLGRWLGGRRRPTWQADGRVALPGSAFGLVFGLTIFVVRYAFGVLFAVAPALRAEPLWNATPAAAGGLLAGSALGWLAGLLAGRPRARGVVAGRWVAAGLAVAVPAAGALAALLAFSAPAAPPRLAAGDGLPGVAGWNLAEVPPPARVTARDGAPLVYRRYPAAGDRAVVLVHGSSGTSFSMHKVAQALQAAGATVYALSLRGHGGSGTRNGDTSYKGQLDDDLADFVRAAGLDRPGLHRSLVGFSSGGGFVLRTASGGNAGLFDDYLAIAPFLAPDSPSTRPAAGGWAAVSLPRLVALSILDRLGLPWFQDLAVVRFATAAQADDHRTPAYSYRLLAGLHLPPDWRGALAGIARPTAIVVGAGDELFVADRFGPLLADLNPRLAVEPVPEMGHMAMITEPRGIAGVVRAWQALAGE